MLRNAGVAGAAFAAATVLKPWPAFAAPKSASPRPIPFGFPGSLFGDPNNTHFYHVLPPLPPDGGQYNDCSTITDFDGFIAAANVNGTGAGTPRPGNPAGRYDFNVDMRVMKGRFIGTDGKQHEGVFGFI
jgi:hypothetical protein